MQADAKWFPELLRRCLVFADFQSLVACEQVNRDWHLVVQDRTLWEELYSSRWRRADTRLPSTMPLLHVKLLHWTRSHAEVRVNTDEVNSVEEQPDGTVRVRNEIDFEPRDWAAIASVLCSDRLTPMLVPQTREGMEAISDGESVHYFEALIHGGGNVGLATVHEDGQPVYDRRALVNLGLNRLTYPVYNREHVDEVTIGCGYEAANGRLFFTKNGNFLGYEDVRVDTRERYAASSTLHRFGNSVALNLGRAPFMFDIEAFIANLLQSQEG